MAAWVMATVILKRSSASRRRDDDYDVLEDGVVVERILKVQVAPQGRPWMWASGHSENTVARTAHGYADARGGDGGVHQELAQSEASARGPGFHQTVA